MKRYIEKVRETYYGLSLPVRVTLWYFICSLFQKGLSFLSTPLFTRILSTDDYGIVSVYNSWYQIIIIFSTLGLSNSIVNVGLVKYEDDKDHFQSSILGLLFFYFILSSTLFIELFFLIGKVISLPIEYFVYILVDSLTSTVLSIWLLRKRIEYDYKKMSIVTIINVVCSISLSIILSIVDVNKARGKILGNSIVALVLAFFCVIDTLRKNRNIINKHYWKFALKYNIPMIPHFLSTVVLNQLDRIMIQYMCGISEAGIYSVAYNSAMAVFILNHAIQSSYNPWLLQRLKRKIYEGISGVVNTILMLYLLILIVIMLFAPEVMKIMAPIDYYEGVYIIPPVASSMFFMLLFNMFAPVEHYSLKTKFMGVASSIAALIDVIMNYIFIKLFGYLAAGYTTLACYIVYSWAHYVYMKKCCEEQKIEPIFDEKLILALSIVVVISSAICVFLYQFTYVRYIAIFVSVFLLTINRKKFLTVISKICS